MFEEETYLDDFLDDELAHYGVLGMKWGHRKGHSERKPRDLRKQEKRAERISSGKSYFRKMNYDERKTYANKRVEKAGSKGKAVAGETASLLGKTAKTTAKGFGATALSAITGGSLAGAYMTGMSFTSKALMAAAAGSSVADITAFGAATGAIATATPVAALSIGVLSAETMYRGYQYCKNTGAISRTESKNGKRK